GRVTQFPRDSQCGQCRLATPWCFPLAPKSGPQPQPDPAGESDQHLGCFAEAEMAAPAPHIRGQLFHCRLDADAPGPSRDLPDSPLKPLQRFLRDRALDARTGRKAEPEELPFLRSCHRTLRLVYLELELLCDEARDALHHPLTRAFAANINVTVVRITNEAVSPALQLAIEFVEHEVAEQWRKRSSPPWSPVSFETSWRLLVKVIGRSRSPLDCRGRGQVRRARRARETGRVERLVFRRASRITKEMACHETRGPRQAMSQAT